MERAARITVHGWSKSHGAYLRSAATQVYLGKPLVYFADCPDAFLCEMLVLKVGKAWRAHLVYRPLGGAWGEPSAEMAAARDALAAHGLLKEEASWLVGEGNSREDAALDGASAAVLAAFAAKGKDLFALLAQKREEHRRRQAEWEAAKERERLRDEARARDAVARSIEAELVAEALRLDAEGLLDGSNMLAGIKDAVDRLKAARAPVPAEGDGSRAA